MWAAMDSNTKIIFVRLLDEGTDVMRPVFAVHIAGNTYRINNADDYDPDSEIWEFLPGCNVRCQRHTIDGNDILVAEERILK